MTALQHIRRKMFRNQDCSLLLIWHEVTGHAWKGKKNNNNKKKAQDSEEACRRDKRKDLLTEGFV